MQQAQPWQLSCIITQSVIADIELLFEEEALGIASFEQDEKTARWQVDILLETPPTEQKIQQLKALGAVAEHVQQLEAKDWVSENQKMFPVLEIGRFKILGSHHDRNIAPHITALQLDAGAAFGTGQHATTSACLEAMEWVMQHAQPVNALDMGCGSGILAMALAKRWHMQLLAVDIDPVAVAVAQNNIKHHRLGNKVRAITANGYAAKAVQERAPYDLIVANILAKPLCHMAASMHKILTPGGYVILSGLLTKQEASVLSAHRQQGLRLVHRLRRGEWSALILSKAGRSS